MAAFAFHHGRRTGDRLVLAIVAIFLALVPAPAAAQSDRWLALLEHMAAATPEQVPSPDGLIYAYPAPGAPPEDRSLRVRANEFLISFHDLAAAEASRRIASCLGADSTVLDQIPGRAIFLLRVNGGAARLLSAYRSRCFGSPDTDGAVTIEPNRIVQIFSNQQGLGAGSTLPWYYRNNGRDGGAVDADTDAAEALSRLLNERREPHEALRTTTVAVIDSGIDVLHPALAPALWVNPAEVAGNGIDDDRNGYRDDVHGWNFGNNNAVLADPLGHGTHVSGIIAARPVPGSGVRGVAPMASVMALKISLSDRNATEFIVLKAIYYAIAQRADVINMSFGGAIPSALWDRAFEEGWRSGVLLVAAAGNTRHNIDQRPVYPCMSIAVTCVVATSRLDERSEYSNFSEARDVIGAPGDDIQSTLPGGRFGPLSGTSMAAPLVSGTLAAIRSLWPDLSPQGALGRLVTALDRPRQLRGTGAVGARLNVYRALYGAALRYGHDDGYCNEAVQLPNGGGTLRRWQNYPYANSGDRGIDGMSLATAYTICTGRQLLSIPEEDLDRIFVLRTHIDFDLPTHTGADQIGVYVEPGGTIVRPFNGIIDGNGFEIRNFASAGRPTAGLFAELGAHAFVTNLRFAQTRLSSTGSAGAVATVSRGRLFNIQVEGSVAGQIKVGGLVGEMRGGSIGSSFFEGTVQGMGLVGGLAGAVDGPNSRIGDSFFQGRIAGASAGGIVGDLNQGLIERSHAFVEADSASARSVGGIAGVLRCRGRIADSYAEGRLSADQEVGGLVGRLMDADISNAYASVAVASRSSAGGAVGIKHDGLKVQIDPGAPVTYYCSGNQTKPPPSATPRTFFDSTLTAAAGAAGEARTGAQLRQTSTFTGWREESWSFRPGFMPALRRLPRTQFSPY